MGRFTVSLLGGDQVSAPREKSFRGDEHGSDADDTDTRSITSDSSEEEPHPLGFGKTRFTLSPVPSQLTSPNRFSLDYSDDEMEDPAWWSSGTLGEPLQSLPPLSSYIDPYTAPTKSLLKYAHWEHHDDGDSERMDKLTKLLRASCIIDHQENKLLRAKPEHEKDVGQRMWELANAANRELREIQAQTDLERRRVEEEQRKTAKTFERLLKRDQEEAQKVLLREQKHEQARREAERALREKQAQEAAEQQRIIEKKQQEEKEQEEKAEEAEKERQEKEQAAKKAALARKKKEREAEAKKTEYVTRAKKLVAKLVELRKTVEPFEKLRLPQVSKRRLNMKKTVRGKLNTLNHDARKVQAIAADVSATISEARTQDEQIKQQLQSGAPTELTSEMARGKRYLLDLLSSNVIVRVQAESFTGVKGDGFPLAAMLAAVSLDAKELVAILAAHIFTVCPTAIPMLPRPSADSSEKELMDALGMGENETFERFLGRTEGTISMVAEIMASKPSNHGLLGGHKGAVEWLERFIGLLPPGPDTTLPLLTAPVLDAFLTGAGHMLANKYPEQFQKYLDIIMNDTVKRLDVGTIGQPSATRLKKLVAGGFDYFKNTLPPGAIPELYEGSNVVNAPASSATHSPGFSSGPATSSASPFGTSQPDNTSQMASSNTSVSATSQNPFGIAKPADTQSSPFGQTMSTDPAPLSSSSPFGAQSQSTAQSNGPSPFGAPSSGNVSKDTSMSNAFGSTSQPSPFSSTGVGNNAFAGSSSNQFGMSSSNQSPFGGGASNPSPFGGGTGGASSASPFPGGGSNPSPFGGATTQPFGSGGGNTNSTPFGNTSATSNQSPFAGSSTPFGSGTKQSTPFGGTSSQGFGNSSSMQSTPFGGSTQPSPFGGGAQSQSTPFGGGTQSQSSPFGGGGNAAPSPFGTSTQNTSFGGNSIGGGKKDGRPPCKFFAQGRCRNGANCRFSHETGGGGNSSSVGGFGGGGGRASNPFGSSGGTNAFGANSSSNPFGAPRR